MTSTIPFRTPNRVLVADDVPSMLSWARRAFSRAGWEVLTAGDGAAAWQLWQQAMERNEQPHLLVTDLNLPNLDGGALMELVRAHCPLTPILVLTSLEIDEAVWNTHSPTRTRLVRKPVTGGDLIEAATLLVQDPPDPEVAQPAA